MSEAVGVVQATSIENGVAGPNRWSRSDLIGISLSVLCAIHCAATPILIAVLPTLELGWFERPWVHQALFFGCFALAANAVLRGYRVHGKTLVPTMAACGLAALGASAFIWPAPCCASVATTEGAACEAGCCAHLASTPVDSSPQVATLSGGASFSDIEFTAAGMTDLWLRLMTPLGGILLVVAHLLNLKWLHSCRCGCCPA